jgi:hypothetical protein
MFDMILRINSISLYRSIIFATEISIMYKTEPDNRPISTYFLMFSVITADYNVACDSKLLWQTTGNWAQ